MMRFTGLIVVMICLMAGQSQAKPISAKQVPELLKPWIDWVLHDNQEIHCPFIYNSRKQSRRCSWPSRLKLDLNDRQGSFALSWKVYVDSWVQLPGNGKHWPQKVSVNNKTALVTERNDKPVIHLKTGKHTVKGMFFWDFIPENLAIPEDSGLVDLTLNDKHIDFPEIKRGQLWLKESDTGKRKPDSIQNKQDLQVFRKIIDDVPLQILTHLQLEISGDQREIYLPSPLLEGFIPMSLNSPIPARIEPDGRLLLQVRPGRWTIELLARHVRELTEISLPAIEKSWPKTEVWVFDARPYQRLVEVKNLVTVDPQQTNLPHGWKNLPAYRVNQGEAMVFKVIRRGDPEPEPDKLSLERTLWLDFDGNGYTVNDKINGAMTRGWRMNALKEMQLGKATLDGRDQLITLLPGSDQQGVEVRKGTVNLNVDSRFNGAIKSMSAVGWQQTFYNVKTVMNLPPGWRLLAASGVDNIPDTWLYRWTLLDLFLVLIAALAISRLWNMYWGLFALITLAIIWHEPGAPHYVWLNILAVTALLKVLPEGKFYSFVKICRNFFWIGLIVIAVPFMVDQIRMGIYPQLEKPWKKIGSQQYQPAVSRVQTGADASLEREEKIMRKSVSKLQSLAGSAPVLQDRFEADKSVNFDRIDPDARVQTGPGLPQWQWNRIHLSWNGPVDAGQQLRFWFLAPAMTAFLNFIRVVLLSILALLMFDVINKNVMSFIKKSTAVAPSFILWLAMLPLLSIPGQDVYADYPDQSMLDDLKGRLLEPPECLPSCAQIPTMQLSVSDDKLQIQLEIHTQQAVAVPLPAQAGQWYPNRVQADGKLAESLRRTNDGKLLIELPQGKHTISLSGKTPLLNKFSLPLPLKPHRVTVTQKGWSVKGVHEHGISDNQLQFSRMSDQPGQKKLAALEPGKLPPFFRVERTLQLGLDWRIRTRVIRVSPRGSAVLVEVPLMTGESVTTPGVRIKNGKVLVNLSPRQMVMYWESNLEKTGQINFTAFETDRWTEVWRADVSPIWHLQMSGISVVHHQDRQGRWLPEWRPWPGENITLEITRPKGIEGQTLTIDRSLLQIKPGKRALDASLKINFRSSEAAQHTLQLPDKAELQSVTINGKTQPIRQKGKQVTLPIKPGKQEVLLDWRETGEIRNFLKTPRVDLGMDSVNASINLVLGQDRWILMTFGPPFGPAVLFWGVLLVIALLSVGLGRLTVTPIKHWQWFLLLVGLSQIPLIAGLTVVAWLIILGFRGEKPVSQTKYFNVAQIGLGLLTMLSLVFLFIAIKQGLLGSPEMQITGNQSSAFNLNWYQDRSPADLPVATVISVPLSIYRMLMLFWSLWLAISLLDWLKWGWNCFASGGLWNKPEPKKNQLVVEAKTKES